jgi:pilus assembly protein FimV
MAREMKDFPSEEKKLEQYGVWVKVEPEDLRSEEPSEGSFKLADLEAAEEPPQTVASDESFTKEEEKLLDELETEIGQGDGSVPESEDLVSFASDSAPLTTETVSALEGEVLPELELENLEEPSIEEETAEAETAETAPLPDLMNQDVLELPDEAFPAADEAADLPSAEIPLAIEEPLGEVDVPLSEASPNVEHFDDLAALEEELATATASSAETVKSGAAVSGEIIARIEAELKSIRSDLTELKKELTVLKKPSKAPAAGKEPDAVGFFEEDEDETIALTGDELDNILSTAEITEGQAEGADLLEEEPTAEEASKTESEEATLDELPQTPDTEPVSDLELESLGIEGETPAEALASDEVLELEPLEGADETGSSLGDDLEMELESLPEIEEGGKESSEAEAEPLELEPLDEDAQNEAAPMDLESIPEFETAEPADESLSKAADEAVAEEIDLEALSPEGEEAVLELPTSDAVELETEELEALPEEGQAGEDKGIEIAFEEGGEKAEEEIMEAEEVGDEPKSAKPASRSGVPDDLKNEIRTVLKYMDQLLEALPEEKIQEFASSEYFVMYKKLFEDLGLGE